MHTRTQDHALFFKDGRFIVADIEWWASEQIDGPYHQLIGLSPQPNEYHGSLRLYDLNAGLLMNRNDGPYRVTLSLP
jgi:hypothetical protein